MNIRNKCTVLRKTKRNLVVLEFVIISHISKQGKPSSLKMRMVTYSRTVKVIQYCKVHEIWT